MTDLNQHKEPFIKEEEVLDFLITDFLGRKCKDERDLPELMSKLGEIEGLVFSLQRDPKDISSPNPIFNEPPKYTFNIGSIQVNRYTVTSIGMYNAIVNCIGNYLKDLYIQKIINKKK